MDRFRTAIAAGWRAGIALGLLELGLSAWRWPELGSAWLRALLVLVPLGLVPLLGALLGLLAGGLGRVVRLRWLGAAMPVAAALALAAADLRHAGAGALRSPFAWFGLAAAAAAFATLAPRWTRWRGWSLPVWLQPLPALAALAVAAAWLGFDRDPRLLPAPDGDAPAGPDVVLVTWDTVRADVLPPWGGTGIATPNLDRLAARSVAFEQMVAPAPITGPSHASLLSGRVPPSHGLRSMGTTVIGAEVPLLAESFRAAGYDTAAFVAAPPLRAKNGFARGFALYDDRLRGDRLRELTEIGPREMALARWLRERVVHHRDAQLDGAAVLERARAWLASAHRPAFLWLHFFDAHGPHDPPPELAVRARALAAEARPAAADEAACGENLTLYRAEIMELDALLGGLLKVLEARDPGLARTVLVLTADHGQCFGEGGYRNNHTSSLMEATQHVPALVHLPGGAEGGRRVAEPAALIDFAATLASLGGVTAPAGQQGIDLGPALRGQPLPPRAWFAEGFYLEAWQERLRSVRRGGEVRDERLMGLRIPGWKLLVPAGDPAAARLFRLDAAGETEVAAESSPHTPELRSLLQAIAAALPRVESEHGMSAADRSELAALGYIDDEG